MHGRLVAIGGGGSTHGLDTALDRLALGLSGVPRPRLGFIGWATPQAAQRLEQLRSGVADVCDGVAALPAGSNPQACERWLDRCDAVYVAGGNTLALLRYLQAARMPDAVARALRRGLVLIGVSAGASVWFECALSDAGGRGLARLDGLGLFAGSFCPHYDTEPERRPAFEAAVASGALPEGLAADDGAAVVVAPASSRLAGACSDLVSAHAARPGANAWRVSKTQGSQAIAQPP